MQGWRRYAVRGTSVTASNETGENKKFSTLYRTNPRTLMVHHVSSHRTKIDQPTGHNNLRAVLAPTKCMWEAITGRKHQMLRTPARAVKTRGQSAAGQPSDHRVRNFGGVNTDLFATGYSYLLFQRAWWCLAWKRLNINGQRLINACPQVKRTDCARRRSTTGKVNNYRFSFTGGTMEQCLGPQSHLPRPSIPPSFRVLTPSGASSWPTWDQSMGMAFKVCHENKYGSMNNYYTWYSSWMNRKRTTTIWVSTWI